MTLVRLLLYSISLVVLVTTLFAIRLVYVLERVHASSSASSSSSSTRILDDARRHDEHVSIAIFLGSGGHTAEMMRIVAHLDWNRYSQRTWIVSDRDEISRTRALEFERSIGSGRFKVLEIPRARRVHQPYLSSIPTTLYSFAHCFYHIALAHPTRHENFADLIVLNGPGSCVPIALCAFFPRLIFGPLRGPRLIYVESLARTRNLSLSAKLVRPFVDRFFVQWESLRDRLEPPDDEVTTEPGGAKSEKRSRRGTRWRLKAKVEYLGWLV
ncbi:hypothetical protein JCM3766R1_007198 [Sporobolomyces carnicolor]